MGDESVADSTYVSFYKMLGGISGAALAGTADLAAYARVWRHRYGGMVFQQWPAVFTALAGLDRELPRIPGYVRHASTVAAALGALPGARVYPEPPHTQAFRLWLPYRVDTLNDAAFALAEEEKVWFTAGWRDTEIPGVAVTEISVARPALDWTAEDIAEVGARFLRRCRSV